MNESITIQKVVQETLPGKKERDLFLRKKEAALTLQAHWRGWAVRRKQRSKAVREARLRVERTNSLAKKSNSLCERLPHIITLLLRRKYLSTDAEILNTLGE